MNEVTTIHLGRTAFTVAADAYSKLKAYLGDIQKWVGKEVTEEVELRMAELLSERGLGEQKVVLMQDVEYLREQLGEPKDFADDDGKQRGTTEEVEPTEGRRLYRDAENAWFGGVAAGLGAYFGVPAWVIRLIFIGLTFAGALGALSYFLLWILVPEAKTPSDRLRMQGKPVTVDTIKEYVATNPGINEMKQKAASMAQDGAQVAARSGTVVGRIILVLAKAFLAVVGAIILISGLASALYIIGMGSYVVANPDKLFDAGRLFPVGTTETLLLILGLFVAFLVATLVGMVGLSMIRRRWPLPGWVTAILVSLVLVGGAIGTSGAFAVAPKIANRYDAARHTTSRQLPAFTSLSLTGDETNVTYRPGAEYKLYITSVGQIDVRKVNATVQDGKLTLNTNGFRGNNGCGIFCIKTENIQVVVEAPKLTNIDVTGEASLGIPRQLNQSDLTVTTDGSGNFGASYLYPTEADMTINGPNRTIALHGLRAAEIIDTLSFDAYNSSFYLSRADTVNFKSSSSCSDSDGEFVLSSVSGKITVNGTTYQNQQDLRRAYNFDEPSPANCLILTNDQ